MKPIPFFLAFLCTLYSGAVYAASSVGVSLESFAFGAASLVATAFWLWVNSVAKKQADTEKMVAELQKALLSSYSPKQEIAEMIREVRSSLNELRLDNQRWQEKMEKKFDHLEQIYGR